MSAISMILQAKYIHESDDGFLTTGIWYDIVRKNDEWLVVLECNDGVSRMFKVKHFEMEDMSQMSECKEQKKSKWAEQINGVCGRKYRVFYHTITGTTKVTVGILDNFAPSSNIVLRGETFNIIKYSNIIQMEEIIDK